MSDVFISYARSTAKQAQQVAEALRSLGYSVWIDDDLPAHRTYSRVIEEQMTAAKAAVVIWSTDAVQSEWVMSEANRAREDRKLVQVTTDKARLPMPFDTIQCADLAGWSGDTDAPGWRKVVASIAELMGSAAVTAAPVVEAPLPLPSKPSIAVMPFANLSGDPEQDYFADGMVVEITNALSRFKSLFVIASSSSLSLKGVSPTEAAHQLGVRYVLEGSVRKSGNRVRIAVQLADTADAAQIWADRFEGKLEDVFELQDEVALSVAGVIEPRVREAEIQRVSKRPTENLGSYDLYLRALAAGASARRPDMLAAQELFHRAINLDPGFGPALASAAFNHAVVALDALSAERESHREQSVAMMQQALQVAGDDPAVLASVAGASIVLGRDTAVIVAMIDRALALNPGSAVAWSTSGRLRVAMGEPDLAVQHLETAMRLDPLSSSRFIVLFDLGAARFFQGRFHEAIDLFSQSAELRPAYVPTHHGLAAALGHVGRIAEARVALAKARALGFGTTEELAERRFRKPKHRKLFLDGIALAEGKTPAADPA